MTESESERETQPTSQRKQLSGSVDESVNGQDSTRRGGGGGGTEIAQRPVLLIRKCKCGGGECLTGYLSFIMIHCG